MPTGSLPGDPRGSPGFPVVAIGASAGGLSALLGLLEQLPPDCAMAFVVVLHLPAKDSESVLPILSRGTSMPVVALTGRTSLETDHIYVVPQRHALAAAETSLRSLRPQVPSAARTSIDQFFRAVAKAYGGRCVGVVLSGTGTEGAIGLAHIREQGGVTIAQAPEDADHDGMPRAAIARGVDLILPVNRIAAHLVQFRQGTARVGWPQSMATHDDIMEILRSRTGHDFRNYKPATVLRAIRRRLQIHGLPDLATYGEFLRDHVEESGALLQDILAASGGFFQDRAAMDSLARSILPNLTTNRRSDDPLRIWVVGCGTGEEAYSLSILLHELAAGGKPPAVQVFATDIDDRALAIARSGLYPEAIAEDVGTERLTRFFLREDDHYRVSKAVRDCVLFASHDILRDAPFSRQDLILCRNLPVRLEQASQVRLFDAFRHALKPGGHLVLGCSDGADAEIAPVPPHDAFTPVDESNRIYVTTAATAHEAEWSAASGDEVQSSARTAVVVESPAQMHRRMLVDSVPASVLVDDDLTILHMSAGAGRFMVHTSGTPDASLMSNIHPGLRLDLRTALLSAAETGRPVAVHRVPVAWQSEDPGEISGVDLRVVPHRDPGTGANFSLILLETVPIPPAQPSGTAEGEALSDSVLSEESRRLKDQLRQTIARFDRSDEALRSSNAQLAALEESLRHASREAESREEELQSLNEELIAVSRELKAKIDETAGLADDLQNLSVAGSIIALFVDRGMNIRRFTPAAAVLFSIGVGGLRHTLQEIAGRLGQPSLCDDAAECLRLRRPVERMVGGDNGRAYLARIQPYRTLRESIDGVVLNLVDATDLQQAQDESRDAAEVLRLALESTANHAVVTLDEDGRIESWNDGARDILGFDAHEILGQSFGALADAEERARGTPEELMRTAREQGRVEREQRCRRKDGSTFPARCLVTALHGDPSRGYVGTIRDLSNLREAQYATDQLLTRERNLTDRLAAARRHQDDLFDVLAGELKRPLNLVQVNAEMLMRLPETRNIPLAGKIAGSIGKAVANQSHIIDSLRDLSLARSGKLSLQMRTVELRDLVERVVKSKQDQAETRSLALEFQSDGDPLTAICDPARVEQIMRNLIANAIKFTEHGGITVRVARDGEFARLSVADTGAGLAAGTLETVFDGHDASVVANARTSPGLGIGLPLVRELVAAHEGRIVAESQGAERGAVFTVWLRLVEHFHAAPSDETAGDERNPLSGLRIVLVDDSLDLLTAFGSLLALEGAQVETFDNAEAALKRLLGGSVDLLISDLGMPGMNGYELITEVRRQPQLAALPAIALTGYGRTRDPGHAVRSGFNAHTTKPVALDELKSIVSLLNSL